MDRAIVIRASNLQLETTEKFTCYIFSAASFILLQYRQDFEGLP